MSQPMEPKQKVAATPVASPREIGGIIAARRPRKDPAAPAVTQGVTSGGASDAAEQLDALLARHTKVGHVFLEIAVGPEWAAAALERNHDNRPIRKSGVATIARAMREGRYRDKLPMPICFDIEGILRDGQHRLSAVVESGCTIFFTVCFGCDPGERDYYDQGIPRSVSDIAREHGHASTTLAQAVAVLILRVELGDGGPLDRNMQTERIDALFAAGPDFAASLRECRKARALVPPTTGALAWWYIAAHTEHRDKLDGFWEDITRGVLLAENHPALRVRNYLMAERGQRPSREGSVKKAAAIVLAWNAVMERRRPRGFKWDQTTRLPEVV